MRIDPGVEYVKFVLHKGRLVGAMLIGETGLEVTTITQEKLCCAGGSRYLFVGDSAEFDSERAGRFTPGRRYSQSGF